MLHSGTEKQQFCIKLSNHPVTLHYLHIKFAYNMHSSLIVNVFNIHNYFRIHVILSIISLDVIFVNLRTENVTIIVQ